MNIYYVCTYSNIYKQLKNMPMYIFFTHLSSNSSMSLTDHFSISKTWKALPDALRLCASLQKSSPLRLNEASNNGVSKIQFHSLIEIIYGHLTSQWWFWVRRTCLPRGQSFWTWMEWMEFVLATIWGLTDSLSPCIIFIITMIYWSIDGIVYYIVSCSFRGD